jgi:hypothetical protein
MYEQRMYEQRALRRLPLVGIVLGVAIAIAALLTMVVGPAGAQSSDREIPETNKEPSSATAAVSAVSTTASTSLATTPLGPSTGLTADDLVERLVGTGVTTSPATYKGTPLAAGTFSGGTGILDGDMEDGVILSSGRVFNVVGPNIFDSVSSSNGIPGDSDLNSLASFATFDATVLEFDFKPDKDKLFFSYIFASDEYEEWVNTQFNDVFGFFVNGQNCATTPSTASLPNRPVSINTINNGRHPAGDPTATNPELYINNDLSAFGSGNAPINTEMDGLTKTLTCEASVTPNQTNHMKLAIADASDSSWDSNVFLKSGSLSTTPPGDNPNQPPTADAGGPYTVDEGSPTNPLDGSGSDPENGSLTYAWDLDNDGAYNDSTAEDPNFDASNLDGVNPPNTVTVGLQVTDDHDLKATDTAEVTINNVPPKITNITASAQNALSGNINSVTFTGQADDPANADGQAGFSWKWALDGGAFGSYGTQGVNNNTFKTSFSSCGNHTVSAQAKDKDNGESAVFPSANDTPVSVSVYDGAFKPPLVDGTLNQVQKGQVVPVKISVGCNGTNLAGLSPHIQLLSGNVSPESETTATAVTTTSVSSADSNQTMRPVDGGYIYNLRVPDNATANQLFTIRVNPWGQGAPPDANGMYAVLQIRK